MVHVVTPIEKKGRKRMVTESKQETRMQSQALNRAMPHSRSELEERVNRNKIIFYLAVQL